MIKNPVYGFEKPYLENIKKENSVYVNEAFYDEFDNLIMIKSGQEKENSKSVLVGICVSENSFLVTDISDNGEMKAVSLFNTESSAANEKIAAGNKIGYIRKEKDCFIFDFGCDDRKSAERIAKPGDALYIKPYFDNMGNYFFSNEKTYALKNIAEMLIKNEYPCKVIFCFIREKQKGAYALGKNIKADYAFFPALSEEISDDIAYLKKEKNYISDFTTEKLPVFVSENNISNADSFYLAGGCERSCGIAFKCRKFDNGAFKIPKKSVETFKNFLENFGEL